jgi:aryl-alcohol dehydrogenase-like predicted oxidoreductase
VSEQLLSPQRSDLPASPVHLGVHEQLVALGRTDLRVGRMGAGAFAWGSRYLWGYGNGYGATDLQQAFSASIANGITFFDTAEMYSGGRSERFLGQFARSSEVDVVIATKFAPLPWRLRRSSLLAALRRSLQRLGLKRVDLYQIHFPMPPVSIDTWTEGMAEAIEAGLTRTVGVSNYSAAMMRRAHALLAAHGIPLASNQVDYSLLHRQPERDGTLQACRELGVTLMAYTPLASGLLTGKYTPESLPSGMIRRRYSKAFLTRIQPLLAVMRAMGQKYGGKTPAQVAINWTICKGTLPIPGAKNEQQARDNAGALGWRLSDQDVSALDAASDAI